MYKENGSKEEMKFYFDKILNYHLELDLKEGKKDINETSICFFLEKIKSLPLHASD